MKRILVYRIMVVIVLVLLAIVQISMPRQLVVYPNVYIEAPPTPERMLPGEPARNWELPVVIY
jgi:hypothetical protein